MQIHIAAVSPLDFSVWWMLRGAFNCTLVLLLSGASILKSPGQKMLHVPRNPQGMSRFQWIHFFSLIFIPFLKQVFSDNYFSAYHLPNVLFHHNERYHCTFVPPSAPYLIPIKVLLQLNSHFFQETFLISPVQIQPLLYPPHSPPLMAYIYMCVSFIDD